MSDRSGASDAPRALNTVTAAMRNRCPICGGGALTRGLLTPLASCPNCGQDFTRHNAGDGAVFIVMTVLCFAAVGAVAALELTIRPPFWAHVVVTLALTLGVTLALLPLVKRFMVAQSVAMDAGVAPPAPADGEPNRSDDG